jgi:hypothetical protein
MTGGIDVRLLSKLTFGKQREVKKHELRLKVRSMPITVPDAIAKAVHLSFPNATRVLCAKHLKDNAIVNLGKSLPQPEVTKIITKLFGESGILASEDQVTFDVFPSQCNSMGPNMTGGIDVCLLSKLTFGKQRGVKKHELRLKVWSMPITVPDAIKC